MAHGATSAVYNNLRTQVRLTQNSAPLVSGACTTRNRPVAKQTDLKHRPTFHTRPVDTFSARKNTPQHRWEKRQAPRQGTQPRHKTTGATRAPKVSPTAPPAVRTSSALAHLWDTKKTRFPSVRSLVKRLVDLTTTATATRALPVRHTTSTCKRRQELTVARAAP